jgi:hypothetical protein
MSYSTKARRGLEHARDLYKTADREHRALTDAEVAEVESALDAAEREREIKGLAAPFDGFFAGQPGSDLGSRFVNSAGFGRLRTRGRGPTGEDARRGDGRRV